MKKTHVLVISNNSYSQLGQRYPIEKNQNNIKK